MWEDIGYCWVVLCKNKWFHLRQSLFSSHRIPLGESDGVMALPALGRHFRVRCDECGKEYFYKPSDVRRFEQELPENFTPHPLFRLEGERRRSKRSTFKVAVSVRGESPEGAPFQEATFAISASENGALIALSAKVRAGQTLFLTNPQSRSERQARVVRIDAAEGSTQVGVEFAEPTVDFWPAESLAAKAFWKKP